MNATNKIITDTQKTILELDILLKRHEELTISTNKRKSEMITK